MSPALASVELAPPRAEIADAAHWLAAARLVRKAGATVSGASFVIDLPDLGGAELLRQDGFPVRALVTFPGA